MLYTTVPGYIVSLVLYLILGMQFGGGTIQNEEYTVILDTLQANFVINPIMVIPPIIVLILILMKKPCLPTFAAGIASAIVLAIVCQGTDLSSAMAAVVSGTGRWTFKPRRNQQYAFYRGPGSGSRRIWRSH